MQRIIFSLFLLFLAYWQQAVYGQLSTFSAEPPRRYLYVQIAATDLIHETSLVGLTGGDPSFDTLIYLTPDQRFYRFSVPAGTGYDLIVGDDIYFIEGPENIQAPIYLTIHLPGLLPNGMLIWNDADIERIGEPATVTIRGKLPIELADDMYLHIPFHPWPGRPIKVPVHVEHDGESWTHANFKVQGEVAAETIVFLEVGQRYFPILMSNETGREAFMDFHVVTELATQQPVVLDSIVSNRLGLTQKVQIMRGGKPVVIEKRLAENREDINPNQLFLNNLTSHKGMSPRAYEDFVAGVIAPSMQQLTQRKWTTALSQFQRELGHEVNLRPSMEIFTELESDNRIQVFRRAFNAYVDEQYDGFHDRWELFRNLFITLHMLVIVALLVVIVAQLVKPGSMLGKLLPSVEIALLGVLFLGFMSSLVDDHGGALATVGSVGDWLMAMISVAIVVIMVREVAPDLFDRNHRSRFFLHLGLLVVVVVLTILFYDFSKVSQYFLLWISGEWALIDSTGFEYQFRHTYYSPMPLIALISSTIYGSLRHLLLQRVPKLQRRNASLNAELSTLKTQISPHFFFNSLNTVYSFSLEEESPRTSDAITRLSDLMRFVIYQADKESIQLEEEIAYLSDYIELQSLRLDPSKHQVNFEIDGEPQGQQIAPLLLISLIENAFKHGISMSEPSFIKIHLWIQAQGLILTIENSDHAVKALPDGKKAPNEGGVGLVNIRRRLDLLYPDRYDWVVETKAETYFTRLSLELV